MKLPLAPSPVWEVGWRKGRSRVSRELSPWSCPGPSSTGVLPACHPPLTQAPPTPRLNQVGRSTGVRLVGPHISKNGNLCYRALGTLGDPSPILHLGETQAQFIPGPDWVWGLHQRDGSHPHSTAPSTCFPRPRALPCCPFKSITLVLGLTHCPWWCRTRSP